MSVHLEILWATRISTIIVRKYRRSASFCAFPVHELPVVLRQLQVAAQSSCLYGLIISAWGTTKHGRMCNFDAWETIAVTSYGVPYQMKIINMTIFRKNMFIKNGMFIEL